MINFHIFIKRPGRSVVVFLTIIVGVVLGTHPGLTQDKCKLVAGYGKEQPFHFPDEMGKIVGIDADLLRAGLADVGCELEFTELPWKRTLSMIRSGGIDATLGASFKEDRAKYAHYSVPYRGQPHVIFENINTSSDATNLEDFLKKGRTLGVILGWHYTNGIQKLINAPVYQSQVYTAPHLESALKMIDRGRLDGFMANPSQVAGVIGGKENLYKKYHMIKADIDILHFLFSKASVDGDLAKRFNRHMEKRLDRGFFFKVCEKYEHMLISECRFLSTTP